MDTRTVEECIREAMKMRVEVQITPMPNGHYVTMNRIRGLGCRTKTQVSQDNEDLGTALRLCLQAMTALMDGRQ